jgi:hypothetical protein
MNTIIMFLLVLCIFLMVSLGINYSKVVSTTITKMKEYTPSPILKTKYNTPVDYYSDTYASQGVFSKSVILETHILEPMTTKSPALPKNNVNKKGLQGSSIPKNNVETWGYKGTQGSKFTKNTNTESSKKYKGTNQIRITGCNSSQYGCCPDNITSKNSDGSNCPVGACSDSQYGCCPDNVTSKNADGSNCPVGCIDSQYGCCPDNITSKNADGSNCSSVSGVVATGPVNTGYAVQGPQGNIYTGATSNCSLSPYGCCPDNVTSKNADGSNCSSVSGVVATGPVNTGYAVQGPQGNIYTGATSNCSLSPYGCCSDNVTSKNADGSNCSSVSGAVATGPVNTGYAVQGPQGNIYTGVFSNCSLSPYGCCPDNVTAKNADGSNCPLIGGCSGTQYGCCPDNVTAKSADGSNCPIGGCSGTQYGCCPDNVTAKSADGSNCPIGGCSGTQYGCCPDNITAKSADGTNCVNGSSVTVYSGTTTSAYPQQYPSGANCSTSQYGCCPDNFTTKNMDGSNCSPYPPPPVQPLTNTVFIPPPKKHYKSKKCSSDELSQSTSSSYDTTTPPPCPPCGRCPEPSFDCKKVPNYSSTNSEYLPMPVLNDFSQFGM